VKFNDNYIPELGRSGKMRAKISDVTEEVADVVRRTAPEDTGEYADMVRTELIETPNRVVGKVIADSDHSMLVESMYGTLGRALNSVSGRG